ncbi:LysM peptidoglycan-binding domain-containing protein [Paeniglutamicibacter cryotolerans]|uniref:Nucleoid-associated protein YgaU n=1 Tax=Paeniglutamicibacter cryotolerans TaxID=670079 RepID=A0A839QN47_9MICC|nr:LysM peptidoglycan-binding domain-containing protein [Paeniglutamicibacter cryotolerans]MBB2996194.1 nucleoid-associated protein YgaU [Paeniglutamicibacter cryotolerans]
MADMALSAPIYISAAAEAATLADRLDRAERAILRDLPPLRLTRRGRFVLIGLPVMLVTTALLLVAGIFTAPVMAADRESAGVESTEVAVLAGDSLWGLAAEFAPNADRRTVIKEIIELNNLRGKALQPGQIINIPVQR